MKKRKKVRQDIQFSHGSGWQFRLTPRYLQHDAEKGELVKFKRRVRRTDIRDIFTIVPRKIDCQYAGRGGWVPKVFSTGVRDGFLRVGCQTFTLDETAIIRKWAVGKKTK